MTIPCLKRLEFGRDLASLEQQMEQQKGRALEQQTDLLRKFHELPLCLANNPQDAQNWKKAICNHPDHDLKEIQKRITAAKKVFPSSCWPKPAKEKKQKKTSGEAGLKVLLRVVQDASKLVGCEDINAYLASLKTSPSKLMVTLFFFFISPPLSLIIL